MALAKNDQLVEGHEMLNGVLCVLISLSNEQGPFSAHPSRMHVYDAAPTMQRGCRRLQEGIACWTINLKKWLPWAKSPGTEIAPLSALQ